MEPETWRKVTPSSESTFPGAKATVLGGKGLASWGSWGGGASSDPLLVVGCVSGYW